MGFFLGVDGGQSSTVALIAREDGRVVGSGKSGPCNQVGTLADSIRKACYSAALDCDSVRFMAVCCGISGGASGNLDVRTEHLRLVTDGEIALTGAFSGKPGIIVIAGTGSICFGRNTRGKLTRAGGWGYIFGDEGSAFDIARQATRAALRFEEGWGPKTDLHPMLLAATNEQNANAMLHTFYSEAWPRWRVAQLAVLVDAAAENGDSVARAILDQAAQSLAMLAACVRDNEVRVSYAGGVFRSSSLLQRFRQLIDLSGRECVPPNFNPAGGALLEAFQLCGLDVTPSGISDMK